MLELKKPSTVESFDHISKLDGAIDADSDELDHDKWMETGDRKFLPLIPGEDPTVFTMRPLSGRETALVQGEAEKRSWIEGLWLAVRLSLRSCTHMKVKTTRTPRGFEVVTPECMEILSSATPEDRNLLIIELGTRAMAESRPKKS